MTALLVALSTLTLSLQVPGGWLLAQRLTVAGAASHLPVAPLVRTAEGLWTCFHDGSPLPVAQFLSRSTTRESLHRTVREGEQEPAAAARDGAIPSATPIMPGVCDLTRNQRPAIVLYRPYYAPGGQMGVLEDLPVDTASALYTALVQAAVATEKVGTEVGDWTARAQETMAEVPSAQRHTAFQDAAVDFLAHALTVAHEIGRHERRRRARGATLCGLFDRLDSLFGSWVNVFGTGHYGGLYHDGTDWVASRSGLSVDDRQWLVRTVLSRSWTGDARTDFAWLCDESSRS